MDKVCLIYQCSGGGDCLFLLKLARKFYNEGYQIVWPVVFEYANFQEYIPWITWVSWQDQDHKLTHKDKLPDYVDFPYKDRYDPYAPNFISEEFVYINGFLNPNGSPVMAFKYSNLGLSYDGWQESVIWDRNIEKEDKLFELLGSPEDFVFVNRNYQARPCVLYFDRIPNNFETYAKKVVELRIIPGYSIFEWAAIAARSSGIYSIDRKSVV